MKFMGSKRSMLSNGLGQLLLGQAPRFDRFVDLFAGSAAVSWFVAERVDRQVISVDLQSFATVLAQSVIQRTDNLSSDAIYANWTQRVIQQRNRSYLWRQARHLSNQNLGLPQYVYRAREMCSEQERIGPVWNAYGGYYFSPTQALTFDHMLAGLPENDDERTVCLGALIIAASECVASPGHTAQPFRPTETAGQYILEAWNRNPLTHIKNNLQLLCNKHAHVAGLALTENAENVIPQLTERDLVFIDPPYSNVQYSRFYHVLETISRMEANINVTGAGRYVPIEQRPQSDFSLPTRSREAVTRLLRGISDRGSTIVFTFPAGESSNGLSGDDINEIASQWFEVEEYGTVEGRFSTLGGNNENRDARQRSLESIFLMASRNSINRNIQGNPYYVMAPELHFNNVHTPI